MGMHHGYLAIEAPLDRALEAMGELTGVFTLGAPVAGFEDLELGDDDSGWRLAIGERDGRTYVLDTSMLLGSDPDFVAALSAHVAATVVGAGAETVSGTFWFVAATSGGLRRFHWNGYGTATAPFDIGEPLATEIEAPLEDLDGDGIMAAAGAFGFELATWTEHGPWRALGYTADPFPDQGELGARLDAHIEAHPVHGDATPTVVERTNTTGEAGFDLAHPKLAAGAGREAPGLPSDRQLLDAVRRRPSTLVWLAVGVVITLVVAWAFSQVIGQTVPGLVVGVAVAFIAVRGMMALASTVSRDE